MDAEIKKIKDKPVKYVVYSHSHLDHASGGKIFTGISHINLLGWFPVPFPDENQLIPFRWVCQEPSNPPQQGADGHRLPQKADPRPSVPFVRGSTR